MDGLTHVRSRFRTQTHTLSVSLSLSLARSSRPPQRKGNPMKASGKSSILEQLQHYKVLHETSKIKHETFQPNEQQQRALIVHNAAKRLVSLSVKREGMRFAHFEKLRFDEEERRRHDNDKSETSTQSPSAAAGEQSGSAELSESAGALQTHQSGKQRGKGLRKSSHSIQARAEVLSTIIDFDFDAKVHSPLSRSLSKTFNFVSDGRTAKYASLLTKNNNPEDIIAEIHSQAQEQTRNDKHVFEAICKSFDAGKVCQFHPKRSSEEIDVTSLATALPSLTAISKLDDLSAANKKKDGILLIFDPSTDTQLELAVLRVTYMKSLDFATEVETSREFTFWSCGTHYNLQLMKEYTRQGRRSSEMRGSFASTLGSPHSSEGRERRWSMMSASSIPESHSGSNGRSVAGGPNDAIRANSREGAHQRKPFAVALAEARRLASEPSPGPDNGNEEANADGNEGANEGEVEEEVIETDEARARSSHANVHAAQQYGGTEHVSLPGWQSRAAIFIPATKCTLRIANMHDISSNAAVANNLSRLRVFAVCCPHPKAGLRKVFEFLEFHMLQVAVNASLPGGISPLNLAALNGNFEAVQQLVNSGANIDHRCREDLNQTALHAAVIGGHPRIVRFLLSQDANQLLKDDSGACPLHVACRLGNITIARLLIDAANGKRAMVALNGRDQRPVDIAANYFMRSTIEGVMRKYRLFVQPRVSLLDRTS